MTADNAVQNGEVDTSLSVPPCLPQPSSCKDSQQSDSDSHMYRYLRYEEIEPTFFPETLSQGTLCWVLMSKGQGKAPKLSSRARVLSDESKHIRMKENQDGVEEEGRVLVQYPKGSTYRVRRCNLLPVLEQKSNLVLVSSETNDYRRISIVQTCPEDNFLEIGCDFGITVDSVKAKSRLGVDKSEVSIGIAKDRYPSCQFVLGDIFDDNFRLSIDPSIVQPPLVVAMDINGNRELPAVVKCLQVILDSWKPRLVIVKSREMYTQLMKR